MKTNVLPKHAIALDEAKKWIANWRNSVKVNTNEVTAHLIPKGDITEIQQEKGWRKYRAYQAITDKGEFKLLIVGVDDNGNDLVNYPSTEEYDNTSYDYVYDFTTPCPSACSLNIWWE